MAIVGRLLTHLAQEMKCTNGNMRKTNREGAIISINGVQIERRNGCAVLWISGLTNDIKKLIRERLSSICYGRSSSESDSSIYSYRSTLREFLRRYDGKPEARKKGFIGELLTHLVINELFPEYSVVSPFFNKEERNVKKGFDIVLSSESGDSLWITEVKSGELRNKKDANGTVKVLIATAKSDLNKRLNQESFSLWLNAINDARLAMEENSDLKKAVMAILHNYAEKSEALDCQLGRDINVILTGALFSALTDKVAITTVEQIRQQIQDADLFEGLFIIAIQKGTYERVAEFLRQESSLDEARPKVS